MDFQTISDWIEAHVEEMIDLQAELTRRPAVGPENGGAGEWEKARFLEGYLRDHGMHRIEHLDCPDERVPEGSRPNIVATIPGLRDRPRVWVLTHLDVVPPGERDADGSWKGWESDPFELRRSGDTLVGRGVIDNQQSMVAATFAARAFLESGLEPAHTVKLLFVSDEEVGSRYGLKHVLAEHAHLFDAEDAIIVPDGGNEDGSMIEVAEKSVLWLEFRVLGKQAHGSMPDRGRNAFRAACRLVGLLDERLHAQFDRSDDLYDPPLSTFEPTLHAANVPNVNTIPGEDVFCFDCRVLPEYGLDSVLDCVRGACREVDESSGTETELRVRNRLDAPPPTPPDSAVVRLLSSAVRGVLGVEPRAMGIGGMTVAADFRTAGLAAAVWMTSAGSEHQVNEACRVADMLGDARVLARVFCTEI